MTWITQKQVYNSELLQMAVSVVIQLPHLPTKVTLHHPCYYDNTWMSHNSDTECADIQNQEENLRHLLSPVEEQSFHFHERVFI